MLNIYFGVLQPNHRFG